MIIATAHIVSMVRVTMKNGKQATAVLHIGGEQDFINESLAVIGRKIRAAGFEDIASIEE